MSPEGPLDSLPRGAVQAPRLPASPLQIAADAVLVAAAYYLAFRLRFLDAPGGIPERYDHMLANSIGFVVVGQLIVFYVFGLYEKWWRYFRLPDMISVLRACAVSTAILAIAFLLLKPFDDQIPRSVVVSDFLLTVFLIGGARLFVRMVWWSGSPGGTNEELGGCWSSAPGPAARWWCASCSSTRTSALGRSASWTTTRASAACACTASRCWARPTRSATSSTRCSPTRSMIAIPSAPGELRGRVVAACRERDDHRADAADRVRAAPRRRAAHQAAARGPGRGRARPRADRAWSSTESAPTWRRRSCW